MTAPPTARYQLTLDRQQVEALGLLCGVATHATALLEAQAALVAFVNTPDGRASVTRLTAHLKTLGDEALNHP